MIFLSKKNGITLVELVASITILAMIIGATVSLSMFGDKNFKEGVNKSSAHRNANMVSEYLSREMRNTGDFILLSTGNAFADSGYKGFKIEANTFKGFTPGTLNAAPEIDMISDVRFYMYRVSSSSVMHFQVVVNLESDSYILDKEILLNNLSPDYISTKINLNQWYSLTTSTLYYQL